MLCGYLDGAANAVVSGTFDRSLSYTASMVGLSDPAVTAGNEELCIQVPISGSTSVDLGGGSKPATASCTGGTNFTCSLTWNPDFTTDVTTFARFRLTNDEAFFSTSSPSPTGAVGDGEVEDYQIIFTPTAVTIGSVRLTAQFVAEFLAQLGASQAGLADLLALLQHWDPDMATGLTGADRDAVIEALLAYLDPDGRRPGWRCLNGIPWKNAAPQVFTSNAIMVQVPGC